MRLPIGMNPHKYLFLLTAIVGLALNAQAQTFQVIHSFTGGLDGSHPQAGLARDKAGNLYATTTAGAHHGGDCVTSGCGAVIKLSRQRSAWTATPLYAFQGGDGGWLPDAGVIAGSNGTLYGTTSAGGAGNGGFGYGVVYGLLPSAHDCADGACPWTETVLHQFAAGSDGWQPTLGNLVFDRMGNIYGITAGGGSGGCYGGFGCGVVFKLTPSNGGWTETVLYSFRGGEDGAYPQSGLLLDQSGNIYGTTSSGGIGKCNASLGGCGVVFELTPIKGGWTETVLYSFTGGADGGVPDGGLTFGAAGVLYGTTESGGTGNGTVFELVPAQPSQGSWTLNRIYAFPGPGLPGPTASVVVDAAGNLYGTTLSGPPDYPPCDGSVFKLSHSYGLWDYSLLHCFTGGSDGGQPYSPVTLDASGNLFGTAYDGGAYGEGVVWELTPLP
jgi:hypothetical protein